MLTYPIKIEGLRGVGTVELSLQDNRHVYALIGANGVGKTKTLEALFQVLIATNEVFNSHQTGWGIKFCFAEMQKSDNRVILNSPTTAQRAFTILVNKIIPSHQLPIAFLASQNRGFINSSSNDNVKKIGTLEQRRASYFDKIVNGMNNNFTSLNMDVGIEEWFVTLAQSANPYQKHEDNREIEIKTLVRLLSKIDARIDPSFMQISGDGRVSLRIDGQTRELSQLSTGFASILKILQAIISGYGYFTNETQLQHVKGIVLIDEIESHLHLAWQAKIIPLLKELFPNTTFYITTHSSVVLSPLKDGEAYRLERDTDGVVRTKEIKSPSKASLVDVLKDAFDIDINRIKLENTLPSDQQVAKQQLLDLLG